ncbi:MAG TPA: hypothetical protein VE092_03130 [Herbaspirillum sp.]|uniref:hypothetical protein n=1 Tax=Herbaspirillum sp. TaxID=1890675 RepID=UPI002D5A98C6|nr:hypothetical protein [Herbaspirillum sp.]HZG18984.1 hypothetical protein [Herbaspirillum sp.]
MNPPYGATYRGKHISVESTQQRNGDVICSVRIDGEPAPGLRGNPFASLAAAQVAGVAYARALIDTQLDNDVAEHHGYFIRVSSTEQIDGSWVGNYQLHRNDNPVAFRRVTCDDFRGNTMVEAEQHAMASAFRAVDADIAAGRL